MNNTESAILYITAAVSLGGLFMGILAYRLELKNRSNSMREIVYNKQFEFYLEFNRLVALVENALYDCELAVRHNEEIDALIDVVEQRADDLDLYFSSNEILIPESNYGPMSAYIGSVYSLWSTGIKDNKALSREALKEFSDKSVNLFVDIMDSLSIEELSKENTELGSRRNSKIERRKPFQN